MPSATPVIPTQQTAIIAEGAGQLSIHHDAPVPAVQPDVALVRTAAVAINPVDAKMLDYSPVPGAIHGYDFAGTIVALGSETPGHLKVGDRVAGFVHGMNPLLPDVGAFAEYVAASADLVLKLPDTMSFEEGASLGLGLFTAGLGLFQHLQLALPSFTRGPPNNNPEEPEGVSSPKADFVLVAGGSTATGTRALQLLKLAGLRPIATCSPAHFDLARRFGAEAVFDYHDPDCAAAIRTYTKNTLAYALDCLALAETTQLCYGALGRAGGRYVTLEPFRAAIAAQRPLTVSPSWLLALTIFGRKVALDGEYGREANPEDRKFGTRLTAEVQVLLDEGKVDVHPVRVMDGGWEGVLKGVDLVRRQTVSGQKLVYVV
ncbi:zinc-binding alcohol dehydrogenase family protein [Aspergillus homomorphus CBS 101889]|uniref:GroES-like protein n=1 Tax=Aspergillus homomorphus (strain CBS 101889) TaxID=1450537 RepID=A0A395HRU2_ASPHC|nr:GroES-like protein [Aspergillus homomorphus CBS 101889]RAL08964.1 GroES-like protein [Aspergillus homomorphus CBS 101889]